MTDIAQAPCCSIIELRQYTLHPGQRDVLIDLFEREFVETQEAVGMHLVGQFRDLDKPDRYVWIRGFPDMPSRAQALQAFYGGPVWQAHRNEANATMIDSDNVLLLRPVDATAAFAAPTSARAPVGTTVRPSSRVIATIYYRDQPIDDEFRHFFDTEVQPRLVEAGARPIARFETETAENTFPRLPVRAGEHVFIWFAKFPSDAAWREAEARLAALPQWKAHVLPDLTKRLKSPPERLVLEPAARSLLR
ncbi:NIPSNAP family protein [Dokdonella soli]|uniref:NIPSNAP family protein n=1 Tax=Dokdonella soli TaxID=529810 RepID=A0ABP3THD8_9GAMM